MMMPQRVRRIAKSVERTLRKRGVVGSALHVANAVKERLKGNHAPAHAPVETDAAEDVDFDTKYNVSTGGEIPQTDLDVKEKNWIHGSAYVPTSPVDFSDVLEGQGLELEKTTFIDLGSGKGRVLLMAAALPFKRIVGVEFSPSLADIARDNLRRFTGPKKCTDLSVVTMDATKYPLPDGPIVVFMYHPFDEKIMALVEQSLARAVKENPDRRILVVYFKPVHREVWDASKSFAKKREERLFVIYESNR